MNGTPAPTAEGATIPSFVVSQPPAASCCTAIFPAIDGVYGSIALMKERSPAQISAASGSTVCAWFEELSGLPQYADEFHDWPGLRKTNGWRMAARLSCVNTQRRNKANLKKDTALKLIRGTLGPRLCAPDAVVKKNTPVKAFWVIAVALSLSLKLVISPKRAFHMFARSQMQSLRLTEYGVALLQRGSISWPPHPEFANSFVDPSGDSQSSTPRHNSSSDEDNTFSWPASPRGEASSVTAEHLVKVSDEPEVNSSDDLKSMLDRFPSLLFDDCDPPTQQPLFDTLPQAPAGQSDMLNTRSFENTGTKAVYGTASDAESRPLRIITTRDLSPLSIAGFPSLDYSEPKLNSRELHMPAVDEALDGADEDLVYAPTFFPQADSAFQHIAAIYSADLPAPPLAAPLYVTNVRLASTDLDQEGFRAISAGWMLN